MLISMLAICTFAGLDINPARYMDAKQMRQEYNAYFPYGLRTLASKEDVEFLWQLIKKYTPTGIDITQVTKDFEWMSGKLRKDERAIEKLENTARGIQQEQKFSRQHKRVTFKRLPKMYVK